jgi:translation initiation factor 2A
MSIITIANSYRCEQEGPIHDVQWSPQGDFFLVAAGFMPAKVTLFTQKCDPFYDLGSGPYNMVRWSPQVTNAD